jgi:hypothetical protein
MYGSNCKGAEQEGVSILHGNRGVYHDDKQPAFKVVYDAIHEVRIIYSFEWIVSLKTASFVTRLLHPMGQRQQNMKGEDLRK